ncbi:hypothetical protein [Lentibacillus sediminis]|nr:hypothetical protein [Lentibacillus sediminis]
MKFISNVLGGWLEEQLRQVNIDRENPRAVVRGFSFIKFLSMQEKIQ